MRAAIVAGKLDAWMRDGQWRLDPASVAQYKTSNIGRANLGRRKPAVRVNLGAVPGGSLSVQIEEGELVEEEAGRRFPDGWRRALVRSVKTTDQGKTMRVFVIEPAAEQASIRVGERFIEGPFKIVKKINNPKQANEAWKAGV